MSLKIRPLSPALQKVASEQLFEEPEKIGDYVEIIREWIKKSPHLRSRTDDQFIVTMLRCCKYSLERTKYKIDMFYTLRSHMPDWVQDRDPLKLKLREMLNTGGMLPLPKSASEDSPRLILGVGGGFDPEVLKIEELFKLWFLMMDLMMEEDDQMIIAGQMNIMDLKKATLAHFTIFTPSMMKKMTMMMQEGSPFRVKGMHYVNAPSFFEKVFSFFKTFLNDKMKSRLFVHGGDMALVHSFIPKEVLPSEYGGDAGTIEEIAKYWEDKIIANREFLMDLAANYGVDEKKRVGMPKTSESLFGLEGSFRKLDFD